MKTMLAIVTIAAFGATMLQAGTAEARRFGGGASFGYHRTITNTPSASYSTQRSLGAPGSATPRRGLMGAIAGLAFGGLIGALLFGDSFHGINAFDLLVLGGILLVILSLLRRKAGAMIYAGHQFTGTPMSNGCGGAPLRSPISGDEAPQIDRKWFISSAKNIFMRMQAAWDAKDINDIRRFCTPEIASRIEADMAALGEGRALTEVAVLDAGIAEAWHESGYEWAAVHFHAMLREQSLDATGALTENIQHKINEIWIFRHDPRTDDPTWFLAGVQQGN